MRTPLAAKWRAKQRGSKERDVEKVLRCERATPTNSEQKASGEFLDIIVCYLREAQQVHHPQNVEFLLCFVKPRILFSAISMRLASLVSFSQYVSFKLQPLSNLC